MAISSASTNATRAESLSGEEVAEIRGQVVHPFGSCSGDLPVTALSAPSAASPMSGAVGSCATFTVVVVVSGAGTVASTHALGAGYVITRSEAAQQALRRTLIASATLGGT